MTYASNLAHTAYCYGVDVRDGRAEVSAKDRENLEVTRAYIDYLLTGEGDPAAAAGLVRFKFEGRAA